MSTVPSTHAAADAHVRLATGVPVAVAKSGTTTVDVVARKLARVASLWSTPHDCNPTVSACSAASSADAAKSLLFVGRSSRERAAAAGTLVFVVVVLARRGPPPSESLPRPSASPPPFVAIKRRPRLPSPRSGVRAFGYRSLSRSSSSSSSSLSSLSSSLSSAVGSSASGPTSGFASPSAPSPAAEEAASLSNLSNSASSAARRVASSAAAVNPAVGGGFVSSFVGFLSNRTKPSSTPFACTSDPIRPLVAAASSAVNKRPELPPRDGAVARHIVHAAAAFSFRLGVERDTTIERRVSPRDGQRGPEPRISSR
mmetsp:Transcript_12601/g.50628  ORF Transcript_12601/g.50628 Transcript_12601/m.50628 type:complete len:313 (+) Transcript_12601:720-1658(+)